MNENETNSVNTQSPQQETLSPRRRSALVTYLSIMFAVAFLFVAVMMVAETKRLKTMNEELQDSSQKTSASLTNNINALQEENRKLSEANDSLQEQLEEQEASARAAEEQLAELQERLELLEEKKQALEQEKTRLKEQLKEMSRQAEDAVEVSELLHQALAADEAGDLEQLQELLDRIEPLKQFLSATEQTLYEELKIA